MKKLSSLVLTVLSLGLFTTPFSASAAGVLTDCADNKAFQKRLKTTVAKLNGRLKKYEPGSAPAVALEEQIQRTQTRFKNYSDSGLLCGKDGLPHLVASGDWKHAPEFMIPGVGFLYIAGWIGFVGRKYLQTASKTKNPTEKEIIIDVPVALKIMSSGFLWPITAWQEFISGEFVASKNEITVSPR
jgi:photosystem I subunit 3